jgi:MFS family permease
MFPYVFPLLIASAIAILAMAFGVAAAMDARNRTSARPRGLSPEAWRVLLGFPALVAVGGTAYLGPVYAGWLVASRLPMGRSPWRWPIGIAIAAGAFGLVVLTVNRLNQHFPSRERGRNRSVRAPGVDPDDPKAT